MRSPKLLTLVIATLATIAIVRAQDPPKKDPPKKDPPPKTSAKTSPDDDDDEESGINAIDWSSPNLKPPASLSPEQARRFEEAEIAFKKARRDAHARKKSWKKSLEAAIALLKKCQADSATNALPPFFLGIAYQLMGEPKKAVPVLITAIAINAKFHEAMIELGDAYVQDQKLKDGEAQFQKALALAPDHAGARVRVAQLRIREGKFPDARDEIKKVLAKRPYFADAIAYKAQLDFAIEGPRWKKKFEKETAHYIVRTDVDQALADDIAANAELIRRLYDSIFKEPPPPNQPRKFPIIVYKDDKEYHENGGPKGAGGHFDPLFRQLFIFQYPKRDDTLLVLYHEGFHQYLEPYLPTAPQWFNEGFGDFFGPSVYVKADPKAGVKEGMLIRPNRWRLGLVQAMIAQQKDRPMPELMLMSQAQMYDEESIGMNYAQAWSFIYFLCEKRDRDGNRVHFPVLGRYFKELRKGRDIEAAYKETFGKENMDALQEEWRQFISALH